MKRKVSSVKKNNKEGWTECWVQPCCAVVPPEPMRQACKRTLLIALWGGSLSSEDGLKIGLRQIAPLPLVRTQGAHVRCTYFLSRSIMLTALGNIAWRLGREIRNLEHLSPCIAYAQNRCSLFGVMCGSIFYTHRKNQHISQFWFCCCFFQFRSCCNVYK